jgi:hypothetical protein
VNGREKILAAFSQDGTPEIPAVLCYEGIYIRDHWDQISDYPWWYSQSPILDHQLAWRRKAIAGIGQDWFELPLCPPSKLRENLVIEPRGEVVFVVDQATGMARKLIKPVTSGWRLHEPVNSVRPERVPSSTQDIDQLVSPSDPLDTQKFRQEGRHELAGLLLGEHGEQFYSIFHVSAPLWDCYRIWGFEEMMAAIALNPSLVRYASRRNLTWSLNEIRKAAASGADGIWIEDCMVDMIGPTAYEQINLPLIQAMVAEIRALNMQSVYYFCGDPKGKLGLLLATGADAISLEESKKGFSIDIMEVAKYVNGQCVLLGNLDAINLLPKANEQSLRDALVYQIEAGWLNRGRFIMSVGSPITPGTSHQQVQYYTHLTHDLGRR